MGNSAGSHCRSNHFDFLDIDHNFDPAPGQNLESFDHYNDHVNVGRSFDPPSRIDLLLSIDRPAHTDLHVRTDLLSHIGLLGVDYFFFDKSIKR